MKKMDEFIKVAVVGPESTGKSTVANALAAHFNAPCVPEFAREYCQDLNRQYTLEDEVNIFHGQLASERALVPAAQNGLLICDTMGLTVKIWCDHLFGGTPQHVLDELKTLRYDLYLLMDIDLPWEDDALRDFPHLRTHFMQVWHDELQALQANYVVISGQGDERLQQAKDAVEQLL